jgi:hypothetical protein
MPINKRTEPMASSPHVMEKLTFAPEDEEHKEEEDGNIKRITHKSIGVNDKGFGILPKLPDYKFGTWVDENRILHWQGRQ